MYPVWFKGRSNVSENKRSIKTFGRKCDTNDKILNWNFQKTDNTIELRYKNPCNLSYDKRVTIRRDKCLKEYNETILLISIFKKEKRNYTCTTFPLRPSFSIDRKTTFPKPIPRLSPLLLLVYMYVLPVFSPSIQKRKRQEIRRETCFQETGPLAQVHQNDRMFDPCRIPIEELAELTRSQQIVRWGLLYTVCGITVEHGGAWWRG